MKNSYLVPSLLSITIFVIDLFTKYIIKNYVGPLDTIFVTSFFNIVYVENTGSAFGMFKTVGKWFFITISVIVIIVICFLIIKQSRDRFVFSIILGGVMGNLTDRIIYGYVIDFLDFYIGSLHWPAFNIADSALSIGITLLLFKTIFETKKIDKPVLK